MPKIAPGCPRLRTPGLSLLAALLAASAGATDIGFDSFANGALVTTQLPSSHGVTFPGGVVATATPRARSAPNVAVGRFDGELERFAFEAQFTSDQSGASPGNDDLTGGFDRKRFAP